VSGLDPLEPETKPDFEFVRGISEYLPWPDSSFSTIISATSLDHCISLDRSLAEIRRVLRPQGILLLWIGSIPGSPQYEPNNPEFTPADQFRVFHFDAAWFEPMLEAGFTIVDRVELQRIGYSHVMYCLERVVDNSSPAKVT
jgi:ubiquinone/menaquinone biosynthesis C-methylase UbiE